MTPLIRDTWGELRAKKIARPKRIVVPIIRSGFLGMVYGPRGIGKSLWCQHLAYCVASRCDFLGYRIPKGRVCVYADGEMSPYESRRRFLRMEGVKGSKRARKNLYIIRPNFDAGILPDLENESGQKSFERLLPADVALIIIDNLSAWCRSGREDAESWRRVQEWALRMRARGISIVFVHHATKKGGQRGTSMREDVLDIVIALKPVKSNRNRGASFKMHFEKVRHLPMHKLVPLIVRYRTPKNAPAFWRVREVSPGGRMKKFLALKKQGISNVKIAKKLKCSRSTVQHMAKAAKNAGNL
jgi:KaiC/GvpD/RAD55 family RecA-like ATPase